MLRQALRFSIAVLALATTHLLVSGARATALPSHPSAAERLELGVAYEGAEYTIGFGPLPFDRGVRLIFVELESPAGLELVSALRGDLSRPSAVFPSIAAGDVMRRFPQTHWEALNGSTVMRGQAKDLMFAVKVRTTVRGDATFSALRLTYRVSCRTCLMSHTIRIPTSAVLHVVRVGRDPRASQVEWQWGKT